MSNPDPLRPDFNAITDALAAEGRRDGEQPIHKPDHLLQAEVFAKSELGSYVVGHAPGSDVVDVVPTGKDQTTHPAIPESRTRKVFTKFAGYVLGRVLKN